MVHVRALPGTPASTMSIEEITKIAVGEATLLETLGFDAVLLENMFDTPYLCRDVGPEIVASMTAVACAIRKAVKIPFGIQVLAGANKSALAVALASGASFIRCEGFVFTSVADEGIMNSDAGDLLRYRHSIGADHICIYADVKKKHSSHSITADLSIAEYAKAAHFFRVDGVIVTGSSTGVPADEGEVKSVWTAVGKDLKVLIGSGVTPSNLSSCWPYANAFIVGSYLKVEGHWENEIDPTRAKNLIDVANQLRK